MSNITDYNFNDYAGKYNTNADYSALFGGTAGGATSGITSSLSDYASIRNGSYRKLLKAYYAKQDAEKASGKGDSQQKLTLLKSGADALRKSAEALKEPSLWEKKMIKKKDEETGEETETEDYDWEAITKAVKSFIEDYNGVVKAAGESDTKDVLRSAAWMTGITAQSSKMLAKVGITIGDGNKLKLDEKALKEAEISDLKTMFTGYNSFANKIMQKATSISNAANRTGSAYTSSGTYAKAPSAEMSTEIDEEV